MVRICIFLLIFLASTTRPATAGQAEVGQDFGQTPQETALCKAMIYDGHDTSERRNWEHMHHFCDCIRFTNRAYANLRTPHLVKYNLELAIGGCDYVLARATPDFIMRPKINLQKGKALRLFKQEGKAVMALTEALNGDPTLAAAYVELADIHASRKNTKLALDVVTNGLRYAPDSKALQRRYKEFGGNLPYPEPIVKPPEPKPISEKIEVEKRELNQAGAPVQEIKPAQAPTTDLSLKPADPQPPVPDAASPASKPFCRFCPEPIK